jgi:hypothetical protein
MVKSGGKRNVADIEGDIVVYINGMRLNKLRALPKWLLAGRKLAKMFDRLEADPESGFLGYQPAFMGIRSGAAIQYWRSLEDLTQFARDPNDLHAPAWKWYNDEVDTGGGVGFWAELYVVNASHYETFYRNMPPIGLGAISGLISDDERRRHLNLSENGVPQTPDENQPDSDSVTG